MSNFLPLGKRKADFRPLAKNLLQLGPGPSLEFKYKRRLKGLGLARDFDPTSRAILKASPEGLTERNSARQKLQKLPKKV
jgi:hypothetical protein